MAIKMKSSYENGRDTAWNVYLDNYLNPQQSRFSQINAGLLCNKADKGGGMLFNGCIK